MATFMVLLQKELREQWRTMRLPSALALFVFVGIGSPAFARYAPEIIAGLGGAQFAGVIPKPTVADAYAQFAKNVGQLGAALAIILAMGSVSVERDRGTLAFLLSKPVTRLNVLLAKLTALGLTMAAGCALAGALTFVYTNLLFDTVDPAFVLVVGAALVLLLVFTALTFLASVVTRSTIAAAGVGFICLIVLGALSIVPDLGAYTPSGMLASVLEVVKGGHGEVVGPLAAQLAVVVAAFALSALTLQRQEV